MVNPMEISKTRTIQTFAGTDGKLYGEEEVAAATPITLLIFRPSLEIQADGSNQRLARDRDFDLA